MMCEDPEPRAAELYGQVFNAYFSNKKDIACISTFDQFWNELTDFHQIPKEGLDDYKFAKLQTCILWGLVDRLYPIGLSWRFSDYAVIPDADCFDGAADRVCSNTLLDRLISLMGDDVYIPISWDWEQSAIPAGIKPCGTIHDLGQDPPNIGRLPYGNKTLGDVWAESSAMKGLSKSAIHNSLFQHSVQHELAQVLAELADAYLTVVDALGKSTDCFGKPWDDQEPSKAEKERMEKLENLVELLVKENMLKSKTIDKLSSAASKDAMTMSDLAHANDIFITREKDQEKAYSLNDREKMRELLGEHLKNMPVTIPTRSIKEKHPDCRWIFSCASTDKGYKPSPESFINKWKEACEHKNLDFWDAPSLYNGIYLIIDGVLHKGSEIDNALKTKIRNALFRDPLN